MAVFFNDKIKFEDTIIVLTYENKFEWQNLAILVLMANITQDWNENKETVNGNLC